MIGDHNVKVCLERGQMKPRNYSKLPWTGLPEEFAFKILSALEKEFPEQAKTGEFIVEGKIFEGEIIMRIGFLERGRIRQMNFEASFDYDSKKDNLLDHLYTCIDCLGVWMHETFKRGKEDEDLDLPLLWRPMSFQGQTIYLQFSHVNSRLEQEADRLLGLSSEELFNEPTQAEDAFDLAVVDPDLDRLNSEQGHDPKAEAKH